MDTGQSEKAGSSTAEGAADQADQASSPDAKRDDGASLSEVLISQYGHDGEPADFDPGPELDEDAALAESEEPEGPGEDGDPGEDDDDSGDADLDSEDTPEDEDADAVVARGEETDESPSDSDDSELTDEELKSRPKKVQKRFKRLLRQRAELRGKVAELEPAATQYQQILSFMEEQRIAPDSMVELYQFAALENSDPHRALQMLQARATSLQNKLGLSLPSDLQEKVNDGLVDEDYAKQLAQERARQTLHGEQQQREQQFASARQEQAQRVSIRDAVNAWESSVRERDPDYSRLKERFVRTALENMRLTRGLPESPEAGVKWAEEALQQVNASLKPASSRTGETKAPLRSSGMPRGGQKPREPKSMLDAVKRGVEQAT